VIFTVQILTALSSLTVPIFFRFLNRKFNEDSKNVLKKVIRSLQVSFTSGFVSNFLFSSDFYSSNFNNAFLFDCTYFLCIFLDS